MAIDKGNSNIDAKFWINFSSSRKGAPSDFEVGRGDREWRTRGARMGRGTGVQRGKRCTGIQRHGRRLEWRPLTSNVYYSSHSETRKSSLLCIRTSVENGGPRTTTISLMNPLGIAYICIVYYRDACRATVSYASLASIPPPPPPPSLPFSSQFGPRILSIFYSISINDYD